MEYPILYSFRRCPYAMRARMALNFNHVFVELREIVLRDKPALMLKASPKGTVPVMILDDKVIDESIDIVYWAFQGNKEFLKNEVETREFMKQQDHIYKTSLTYYKYPDRNPEKTEEAYREDCEVFMRDFETRLGKTKFLFSDEMEIVDICNYPFIRQLAKIDQKWFNSAPYPNLKRWKEDFDASTLYLGVMKKRDPWQEGDPAIIEDWRG